MKLLELGVQEPNIIRTRGDLGRQRSNGRRHFSDRDSCSAGYGSEKSSQKNQNRPFGRLWFRGLNSSSCQAGGGHLYEDVEMIVMQETTYGNNRKVLIQFNSDNRSWLAAKLPKNFGSRSGAIGRVDHVL
jgi:hypothetical protein